MFSKGWIVAPEILGEFRAIVLCTLVWCKPSPEGLEFVRSQENDFRRVSCILRHIYVIKLEHITLKVKLYGTAIAR